MHIICPECQFSREIPDDKLPARAQLATCPKCGLKFQFRELPPPSIFDAARAPASRPSEEGGDRPDDTAPTGGLGPLAPGGPGLWDHGEAASESPEQPRPEAGAHPASGPDTAQGLTPWAGPAATPTAEPAIGPGADSAMDSAPGSAKASTGDAAGDAKDDTTAPAPADNPAAEPATSPPPTYGREERPAPGSAEAPAPAPASSGRPEPGYGPEQDLGPERGYGQERDFGQEQGSGPQPRFGSAFSWGRPGDEDTALPPIPPPFEELEEYGFFPGVWLTIKRVLIAPRLFFQAMPLNRGIMKPLVFYLLLAEFQALTDLIWGLAGLTGMPGVGDAPMDGATGRAVMGVSSAVLLVLYPLMLTVALFVGAGLNHLCLSLLRSAQGGFEATFRAMAYSSAPFILCLAPVAGPMAAALWSFLVAVIGYKHLHRTSYARVLGAMAIPVLLFMVLALVLMRSGTPTI